jgi:acetylglutamate kinase
VGGDRQGNIYNVNADQMAVACAAGYGAEKLLFLTDVEGVRGGDGGTLSEMSTEGARELIRTGVASGGMEAKLNSACAALDHGVGEVVIAAGAAQDVVRRLVSGERLGTRLKQGQA